MSQITVGAKLPEAKLLKLGANGPEAVDLSEKLKGRKVVIFGLPGAFTGTCSTAHVPSFIRTRDGFAAKGVDEIICVSVNDPFVMGAWGKDQGTGDKVMMLADGNGELARGLGVEVDRTGAKMGVRTKRFVAVVNDGVIESIELEPAGGIAVTGADACLARL